MTERSTPETEKPQAAADAAPSPTLSHRIEYWALRATHRILNWMGPDRASAFMGRSWRLLAPLNRRHARADRHLAIAFPDMSAAERRRILLDMWENLGRTAAETFLVPRIAGDRSRFELATTLVGADRHLLDKGAVFVSLHQGNWEMAAMGIRFGGMSIAAVYRPLRNPLADEYLRSLREQVYDAGLFPRDTATAFRMRTLARQGVAVGMLGDLRDMTGIEVPFFGRTAMAISLPAILARRLGLPLVAGRMLRTHGVRFRIEGVIVDVPRTRDVEADVRAATLALNAQFEEWIRDRPEQWMWSHRRWRDPVGGER